MTAIRSLDHDGLLQGLRESEEQPLDKCPLCEKTIWPDDPTSMVNENEVHRLCALDYRISEQADQIKDLRQKLSELSYRVPV